MKYVSYKYQMQWQGGGGVGGGGREEGNDSEEILCRARLTIKVFLRGLFISFWEVSF